MYYSIRPPSSYTADYTRRVAVKHEPQGFQVSRTDHFRLILLGWEEGMYMKKKHLRQSLP